MKKIITFSINEELLERLKIISVIKSTTIDNLIEHLIMGEIVTSLNLWKPLEIENSDKNSDKFNV